MYFRVKGIGIGVPQLGRLDSGAGAKVTPESTHVQMEDSMYSLKWSPVNRYLRNHNHREKNRQQRLRRSHDRKKLPKLSMHARGMVDRGAQRQTLKYAKGEEM